MKAYNLGYKYGILIVNGAADKEDIVTDFGVPYVQKDFQEELLKENIKVSSDFIEDNLLEIEKGYHVALETLEL